MPLPQKLAEQTAEETLPSSYYAIYRERARAIRLRFKDKCLRSSTEGSYHTPVGSYQPFQKIHSNIIELVNHNRKKNSCQFACLVAHSLITGATIVFISSQEKKAFLLSYPCLAPQVFIINHANPSPYLPNTTQK